MMIVGNCNARVGNVRQPDDPTGQCEEDKESKKGVGIVRSLENNEMEALGDKAHPPERNGHGLENLKTSRPLRW